MIRSSSPRTGFRNDALSLSAFAVAIVIVVPWVAGFDGYTLNTYARYLCLGMVAMALALSWGCAGILNLGQAATFGIGAYVMAMHLKLKSSADAPGGLPDFMTWTNVETLPWFWVPFHSLAVTLLAGLLLPALVSVVIGLFVFRGRVSGVFVAIITLAFLVALQLIFIEQQGYTGGQNGLTGLAPLEIFGLRIDNYSLGFYYMISGCLLVALVAGKLILRSRAGLVLRALRDDPARARFLGYDVATYEIFVFAASAAIAGFAGMLYVVVLEFASPTYMSVGFSLSIVIWCAVGGRNSLIGAAVGGIFVNMLEGQLSDTFVEAWLLVLGVLFILVVIFLPNGLHGLVRAAGQRVRWPSRPFAATASKQTASKQDA